MKRLAWTVSLAAAGIFLTMRSAPIHAAWIFWGAAFGALIGLGFGTIFSKAVSRVSVIYWSFTFGLFGCIYGLEEPVTITRLCTRSAGGIAIGAILGVLRYWFGHKGETYHSTAT